MSTLAVLRMELRRLLLRPWPWLLAAAVLAWLGWNELLAVGAFLKVQDRLALLPAAPGFTDIVAVPLLAQFAEIALLLVPLLSMQALAGERRAGTLSLLLAQGLSARSIVLGKYLAQLLWLLALLALVLLLPLLLAPATTLDWGKLAAATLGIALLLAGLLAVGVACSSYARQPPLAAALALALTLALWAGVAQGRAPQLAGPLLGWISLPTHLQPLLRGLVSTSDLAYFGILIALALSLAMHRLGRERELG
ncbi:ABC transporter, permease protein [mine drainage metagenome]|uniref:ABC transporter, permease protein n=1 Tax=mine drainage metagenome TaxID=410659 RepID=T0ZKP8_9ZZZZ